MTLTLLLDLDDTLLTNQFDQFLSAYLKAWGKYIAGKIDPAVFVNQLLAATQQMLKNDQPGRTLEETFDAAFYPAIGVSKDDLSEILTRFYAEVFPELRSVTSQRPAAIRLVDRAVERGLRLAVATNPLFPRDAILQRLDWAGLPADQYPFEVISTYEAFHFSKPHPAYYSEVLAQMGWPAQPALMIGNSLDDDIRPARQAGIRAYFLADGAQQAAASVADGPDRTGSLDDLLDWLEEADPASLQAAAPDPDAVIASLTGTAAALDTFTRGLSPAAWRERPQPEEWSLVEIICHFRDTELEVNLPRLNLLSSAGNPFIPGVDTDSWAATRDYRSQDGPRALAEFLQARAQTIAILSQFQPADWQRPARHAIFGPTTVLELVRFINTHDRNHVQQVKDTRGAQAVRSI